MGSRDGNVVLSIDGQDLKMMLSAALSWLQQHQDAINALNVFPVPDGDTGTNMTLTMSSAWEEIANLEEDSVGYIANKLAHGALMGARGNSGVILSQIWRGFARGLDNQLQMRASDFATALRLAAETAYKGVVKPVEGTILTVVRELAEEAAIAASETDDLGVVFARTVKRAKEAEARTPALLPVLRQAGVVDSGGQGLVVILEGMWRQMNGISVASHERLDRVVDLEASAPHMQLGDSGEPEFHFDSAYPYDVQFIIIGQSMNIAEVRENIEALGDCPLVVGDAQIIKVHVHVLDPGVPISYGAKVGSLSDVVVEDMQAQYQEFISGRDVHPVVGPGYEMPPAPLAEEEIPVIGVVTVVAGEGLSKVYRSLGATAIIEGGQTMNPSTAQILEAIKRASSDKVIILPNNKNILMAAQQAAEVSEKEVAVVPTRSVPQGVAALLALDQNATLDGNVVSMLSAAKEVITGEVTWATRNVELNGIEVREGDAIGLLDDQLVVDTGSFEETVHWLLAEADLDGRELVTMYHGEGVGADSAAVLAEKLAEAYPDLEFEVVEGGQPHYPYIISIE